MYLDTEATVFSQSIFDALTSIGFSISEEQIGKLLHYSEIGLKIVSYNDSQSIDFATSLQVAFGMADVPMRRETNSDVPSGQATIYVGARF